MRKTGTLGAWSRDPLHMTQESFLDLTKLLFKPNLTLVTTRTRHDLVLTDSSSPDDWYDSHPTMQTMDTWHVTLETNLSKVFVTVRRENTTINVNASLSWQHTVAIFRRIELTWKNRDKFSILNTDRCRNNRFMERHNIVLRLLSFVWELRICACANFERKTSFYTFLTPCTVHRAL
jgi:hypothetical protein